MSNIMKIDTLRDKINGHEYLHYLFAKRDERIDKSFSLSPVSIDRLKEDFYSCLIDWMNFKNPPARPTENQADDIQTASIKEDIVQLSISETAAEQAWSKRKYHVYYDGVALMEAVNEAVRTYSADKGTLFTTWFSLLYTQKSQKQLRTDVDIKKPALANSLSRENQKLLREFLRQMKSFGLKSNNISDKSIERLLASMDWGDKKPWTIEDIRELLTMNDLWRHASSGNDPIGDNDSGNTLYDMSVDSRAELPFRSIESLSVISNFLEFVVKKDTKEYHKLFWSNDFLHPLKDKLSSEELKSVSPHIEQKRVLTELEPILFRHYFDDLYLRFCLVTPPDPDSIENIDLCESRHPFIQKTISEYKDISAARVSQLKTQFDSFKESVKEMYKRMYS